MNLNVLRSTLSLRYYRCYNSSPLVKYINKATKSVPRCSTWNFPLAAAPLKSFITSPVNKVTTNDALENGISLNYYEKVSDETLEQLTEVFDFMLEDLYPSDFDVSLANGVLTIQLKNHGTYVINKQTPNRQIWLSSPTSGPKRYNYMNGEWIYNHDGISLHQLLNEEFSQILNQPVNVYPKEETNN